MDDMYLIFTNGKYLERQDYTYKNNGSRSPTLEETEWEDGAKRGKNSQKNNIDFKKCLPKMLGKLEVIHRYPHKWVNYFLHNVTVFLWSLIQGILRGLIQIVLGVNQGDNLYPTIFNVLVEEVVRHWILLVAGSAGEKYG